MRARALRPPNEASVTLHLRADSIQLLTSLASSASALFIPNLAKDLGANNSVIGLITAIYSAVAFVATYVFARFSDIHGSRLLIKLGLGVCTVTFLLQVLTDPHFFPPLLANLQMLTATRILTGFSIGIFPAALIVFAYDRKEGIGRFSSFGALGNAVGSFVAGLIVAYSGIFILSSVCFLLSFLLSLRMKHESVARVKIPFLPRKILRRNWRVYTLFLLRHTGANCIWVIYPLYIVNLGGDKFWVGVIYTINLGTQFIVMLFLDRFKEASLITTGLLLSAVTFISFALAPNYLYLLPMQLLLAISYATLYIGSLRYLINNNVEKATSSGILSSVISLASVLGSLLGGVLSQFFGYVTTMYIGALFAVAGFLIYRINNSSSKEPLSLDLNSLRNVQLQTRQKPFS
jgi:MFS family permease